MRPPSDPSPRDVSDDWTVNLDAEVTPPAPEPASPALLRRWIAVGLMIAIFAASAVIWGPEVDTGEDPAPVATVLGGHLAVPISLHLPANAVATADGSYVGVQFQAGGVVLVTVPTQVVDPYSGARLPLPTDPATWLARHPDVFVSRVRDVTVAGVRATQLDYRRSRMANPPSRFSQLPLFCGWRAETDASPFGPDSAQASSQACTRITAAARIRATFVQFGDRTVLLEAVWPVENGVGGTGRMPTELQRSYSALLKGLTPGTRNT